MCLFCSIPSFFHYLQLTKSHLVECSTLEELIREARVLFKVAEQSKVFILCFDELWMEKVDVRDKLQFGSPFKLCSPEKGQW